MATSMGGCVCVGGKRGRKRKAKKTRMAKSTTAPARPEPTAAEAVGTSMSPVAAPMGGRADAALTVRDTVAKTPFT